MEKTHTLAVSESDSSKRLDLYLSERLKDLSRTAVQELIRKGLVLVDGRKARPSHRTRTGEKITVTVPEAPPCEAEPEPIPLEILYEDDDILVINKPRGLTVHPGAGRRSGTLVNALLHHTGALSDVGGPLRPGIVHRLDKDTSGVLIVAKKNQSHLNLSRQFKEHSTTRRYHALVWGKVEDESGTVDIPIGRDVSDRKKISPRTRKARRAVTHYRVLRRYPGLTLLEVTPETGRTHQIRVHLAAIKHPVVGDPVYGKRVPPPVLPQPVRVAIKGLKGQLLHAYVLGIRHPVTGKYMEFSSGYPADMEGILRLLEASSVRT